MATLGFQDLDTSHFRHALCNDFLRPLQSSRGVEHLQFRAGTSRSSSISTPRATTRSGCHSSDSIGSCSLCRGTAFVQDMLQTILELCHMVGAQLLEPSADPRPRTVCNITKLNLTVISPKANYCFWILQGAGRLCHHRHSSTDADGPGGS